MPEPRWKTNLFASPKKNKVNSDGSPHKFNRRVVTFRRQHQHFQGNDQLDRQSYGWTVNYQSHHYVDSSQGRATDSTALLFEEVKKMYCSAPNVMAEVEAFVATRPFYSINQENGQRKYGPPRNWEGPPPPKGSEVFVAKLPRDLYENTLIPLFEKVGRIYEFRLMMDFSGSNRGFAFVMYTNVEDAENAIKTYDDYEIRPGHKIGVCKSVDNCRLFVGGIPKDKTKSELLGEFRRLTDGVKDVILYSNVNDKTKNRGFAFIEYETHRAAAMARRKLIPGKALLWGHEIAVDWAEPEPQVGEEIMRRVTVLYARNLTARTTEDHLQQIFSLGGLLRIDKVKKIRDFAFVHYISRSEAELALSRLNGYVIDGCPIEVTWAKPPQCALRNQTRISVEGYRSYPRSSGLFSEAQAHLLNERIANSFQQQIKREAAMLRSSVENESLYPCDSIAQSKPPISFHGGSVAVKYPVILSYLCHERGWGEPKYEVTDIAQNIVDNPPLFSCKVSIPNLPSESNTFMSSKLGRSPEESRILAAQFAISKLGLASGCMDFLMPRSHVPPIEPLSSNGLSHFSVPCTEPPADFGCVGDGVNFRRSLGRQQQNPLGPIGSPVLESLAGRSFSLDALANCNSVSDALAKHSSSDLRGFLGRESNLESLVNQSSSSNNNHQLESQISGGRCLDVISSRNSGLEALSNHNGNLEGLAIRSPHLDTLGGGNLDALGAVGGALPVNEAGSGGAGCNAQISPPSSTTSSPTSLLSRIPALWNNADSGEDVLSWYDILNGVNNINFSSI